MFLLEVPKCPSILARGRRLVSCPGTRGGATASRAGLGRSRRGGRARSSSPASAGPTAQRRGCGGAVSPADASARPRRGELARRRSGQPTWLVVANRPRGGIACRRPKRGARLLGEKGAIEKFLHNHLQDPRQAWMRHDRSCAAQRASRRRGGCRAASLSRDDVMALELDTTPVMWLRAWDERRLCCAKRGLSCAWWSRIAMPDDATRLGRARYRVARC